MQVPQIRQSAKGFPAYPCTIALVCRSKRRWKSLEEIDPKPFGVVCPPPVTSEKIGSCPRVGCYLACYSGVTLAQGDRAVWGFTVRSHPFLCLFWYHIGRRRGRSSREVFTVRSHSSPCLFWYHIGRRRGQSRCVVFTVRWGIRFFVVDLDNSQVRDKWVKFKQNTDAQKFHFGRLYLGRSSEPKSTVLRNSQLFSPTQRYLKRFKISHQSTYNLICLVVVISFSEHTNPANSAISESSKSQPLQSHA